MKLLCVDCSEAIPTPTKDPFRCPPCQDKLQVWNRQLVTDAMKQGEASPPDYQALYFELLYAVGNKYPGESRHDTALRYIRKAEQSSDVAAAGVPAGAERGKET